MASIDEKSPLGKFVDFVRGVASALVGVPTALAASVLVGTMFLMAESMNICYSHVRKTVTGEKKIIFEPVLNDISESLKGAFFSVWTEWGIYGFRKGAEYAVEVKNSILAHDGYTSPFNELGHIYHNPKEADPSKAVELAQQEISKFFQNDKLQDPASKGIYNTMNQVLTAAQHQPNVTQNAMANLTNQGLIPPPQVSASGNNSPNNSPALPPAGGPAGPGSGRPLNVKGKKKRTPS